MYNFVQLKPYLVKRLMCGQLLTGTDGVSFNSRSFCCPLQRKPRIMCLTDTVEKAWLDLGLSPEVWLGSYCSNTEDVRLTLAFLFVSIVCACEGMGVIF